MPSEEGWQKFVDRKKRGGPYFTVMTVARDVGKSRDTIWRWIEDGWVNHPSVKMPVGKGERYIWLFTQEDLDTVRAYAMMVRPGRKPVGR